MRNKINILIVEDKSLIARDQRSYLRSLGYRISTAVNSRAGALKKAGELRPDLVLMDIVLKGKKDGIETANDIRSRFNIPVVFVTASADDLRIKKATRAEPFGYLIRPFGESELRMVIEMALYKHGMDAELRESEKRYRNLFEDIGDAVMVFGLRGRFLDCNDITLQYLGYSRKEFLRLKPVDIVHPDFHLKMKENQKRIMAGESTVSESAHRCKDGRVVPVEVHARRIEYQDEPAILAVVRDITERKQMDEAIKSQKEFQATVIESLTHPFFVINVDDYTVVMANSAAGFDIQKRKVTCYALTHHKRRPCHGKNHRCPIKIIKKTLKPAVVEHIHFDKKGNQVIMELHGYPIIDEAGKVIRIIEYALNITERKRAEQELISYQQQLRTLSSELSLAEARERRQLAEELHDSVGQTLAITSSKLANLLKLVSETEYYEVLEEIYKYITQSIKMTRSLTSELSPAILYELGIDEAVDWLTEQFHEQHNIDIEFNTDRNPNPMPEDVSIVLFKAVRELLLNIAKHAKATHVKVSIQRVNNTIRIKVQDNGIGFDTNRMCLNVDKNRGFGLFNVRERLTLQKGQFEIDSKPGKGTAVILAVPLKTEKKKVGNKK